MRDGKKLNHNNKFNQKHSKIYKDVNFFSKKYKKKFFFEKFYEWKKNLKICFVNVKIS